MGSEFLVPMEFKGLLGLKVTLTSLGSIQQQLLIVNMWFMFLGHFLRA